MLVAIILLVSMCAPCAAGSFTPPVLLVRRAPAPGPEFHRLTSDGRTARELPWTLDKQAPSVSGLTNLRYKGLATARTDIALTYDDQCLYVRFDCADDLDPVAAQSDHDGPVWRDDSVEIFLDPRLDGRSVFHLITNSSLAKYEEQGRPGNPTSWDGPWEVIPRQVDDGWSVTAVIPFRSLGVPAPKPGDTWGANFGRNDRPQGEISSWSPALGQFAEPEWFGRIVFAGSQAPIITVSPPDIGAPGRYAVTTRISNAAGESIPIRAEVLVDGRPLHQPKPLTFTAREGDSEWRFDVDYRIEGRHKLSLQYADHQGALLTRTPPLAVDVAPHLTRLSRLTEIVRGLPETHRDDVTPLLMRLALLRAAARKVGADRQRWAEFGTRLSAMEPEITLARLTCADKHGSGYAIGTETALRKLLRHEFFDGEIGQPLRMSAARNEFESAQLIVMPYLADLKQVVLSVSPLAGPKGAVIPADRVTLNLVEYVRTCEPKYDVDYVGLWPDPLMPMRPFDVPKNGIQPVWVTVHPSDQTTAGVYTGTITVRPANAPEFRVPIEVRVWDFSLPVQPRLKTAFALFEHEIGAWYGGMTDEIKRNYYAFMLDHRLNVVNIYSNAPLPRKEDMPFCVERGQNFLTLAYTHNKDQEDRDELAATIREYWTFLKSNGWWNMASIYGFDEVNPDKFGELRDMYGWVKKEFPDLPRMCTVAPTDELKGSVDVWVPLTSNYIENDAREFEKAGDKVWWYVCCVPPHPYPNFFIDYPAIDQRILFWMNWKYRIPGFLYYAVNLWEVNRKSRERWPEVEWNTLSFDEYNGDGQLIYPGPDGKPVSSIRLECIRDGIEDYEYFAILQDRVAEAGPDADKSTLDSARELLLIDDDIVGSPSDYTLDPRPILDARTRAAELIERLAR